MGLQEALAAVLTCEAELATLREDPARLRHRYGLSDAELAMMAGAPPAGFRITRESVRRKLVLKVTAYLPATVAELEARYPELLEGFASSTVRRPQWGERLTGSGEPEQLVAWIDGRAPVPLVDFARYELLCGQLAHDRQAAEAARKPAATVPDDIEPALAPDRTGDEGTLPREVPGLSPTARVAFFDHDVTAKVPPAHLPVRHTWILLQRQWGEPAVRIYRINDATAALLSCCDGHSSLRAIATTLRADLTEVVQMARKLARQRVIDL
ncbi:hypothetical protein [Streptosporangium sp. NPDC087985]|uniref:hypothetical protein n=1 Tax=Streptosporangium sp. NPDC087985 TaxID=3366196 RepID=UPI00382F4EC1